MKSIPKRLGEIVLRTENPERLIAFYRDAIGLTPYATLGPANFLKVSDDLEGHPQLLAVFDKTWAFSGPESMDPDHAEPSRGSLHHFALTLTPEVFDDAVARVESLGHEIRPATHPAFGWRSAYVYDPDGNSVEFVCYEANLLDQEINREVLHTTR